MADMPQLVEIKSPSRIFNRYDLRTIAEIVSTVPSPIPTQPV
jgi:hypothetical protein